MNKNIFFPFGYPIFLDHIPVDNNILDMIKNEKEEDTASKNSKISVNRNLLNDIKYSSLKNQIQEKINHYAHNELQIKDNFKFFITTSWSNNHLEKDWAQDHIHTNSLISGCYYLQTSENCGDIIFRPQISNVFPTTINLEYKNTNFYNAKDMSFKPSNGTLILFPSTLLHRVETNYSNMNRYSIAFNVFVKGELGQYEWQLSIS